MHLLFNNKNPQINNMTYGDYKHYIKIQVRYKDIDIQGHVNNANHITYFEVARVQYFTDIFARENNWQKTGMILAKTEIDYKVPILFYHCQCSCEKSERSIGIMR